MRRPAQLSEEEEARRGVSDGVRAVPRRLSSRRFPMIRTIPLGRLVASERNVRRHIEEMAKKLEQELLG
jgi:hypothetical protein